LSLLVHHGVTMVTGRFGGMRTQAYKKILGKHHYFLALFFEHFSS
jgi:hypothetical protein